jgi:hypothetical protein
MKCFEWPIVSKKTLTNSQAQRNDAYSAPSRGEGVSHDRSLIKAIVGDREFKKTIRIDMTGFRTGKN